ncbi:MAG: OadG family protein [Bacteroidales bacterium]|nr:OadG family protein [Bacteroidales bacterium]MCF8390956.1 OadG family protein [Bacteroidales bacterium]
MENISINEIIIAVVGYATVFIALSTLYGIFKFLPKIIYLKIRRRNPGKGKSQGVTDEKEISGDETAAIALALHLLLSEKHDEESGVLTIKSISRAYSPWSSKIYAVRNQFNRL